MPWWFWIVLWGAIVVLSVAWLAWHIYHLIRKGARAYDQFLVLNNSFADSWDAAMVAQAQIMRDTPDPGIFVPVSRAYADYERGKEKRLQERISRRIQKRDSLGQPQRVGDLKYKARKGATHG